MRDTQRSAVYEAETLVRTMFDRADQRGLRSVEVMGSTITLPVERKFGSVESVQAYCDQLLGLNWVRETWTRATIPVSVRSRAGNAAAHYSNDVIAVPDDRDGRWALREFVVFSGHFIAVYAWMSCSLLSGGPVLRLPTHWPWSAAWLRLWAKTIGHRPPSIA